MNAPTLFTRARACTDTRGILPMYMTVKTHDRRSRSIFCILLVIQMELRMRQPCMHLLRERIGFKPLTSTVRSNLLTSAASCKVETLLCSGKGC